MNTFQFKIIMRILLLIARCVMRDERTAREVTIIEQDLNRYYRETQ
mgnify:CR=1 FL=1